jgi:hypothetical protein
MFSLLFRDHPTGDKNISLILEENVTMQGQAAACSFKELNNTILKNKISITQYVHRQPTVYLSCQITGRN